MTAETDTRSGPILEDVCTGATVDWRGRKETFTNAGVEGKLLHDHQK